MDPLETAGVLVFTGGPLDGTQEVVAQGPTKMHWFVGCFYPVAANDGVTNIGAYQLVEIGDGIGRTEWIDGWEAFIERLHDTERRFAAGLAPYAPRWCAPRVP